MTIFVNQSNYKGHPTMGHCQLLLWATVSCYYGPLSAATMGHCQLLLWATVSFILIRLIQCSLLLSAKHPVNIDIDITF